MRHPVLIALCLGGTVALAGCSEGPSDAEVERAVKSVNVIDESNLNDIMLTVADPNEAVNYFKGASEQEPDRVDFQRGLAASLIRANEWDRAAAVLNAIPPTYETYERYRLEAMVADSKRQWKKADSYYEIAQGLTTTPASVLNNWGFSKLTRGDAPGAEKLFTEAITYDPTRFTTKNNLVLARGAQRKYDLPVIQMTQTERAELLYTLALTAIKQGDVTVGKGLLEDAIETHPQYFEAAERSLDALDGNVTEG